MWSKQYGMFFQESEAIASEHPDLARVVHQVDGQLSGISSSAPLRPADFSSVLGAEGNQVAAAFELLSQKGVLLAEEMVECGRCQNLMSADDFRQAIDDEDDFDCTGCGHVFPTRSEPIVVYRMTAPSLDRTKSKAKPRDLQISEVFRAPSTDEPLSERAQLVLVAMLELGAIDSDRRKSTEDIAAKALGPGSDANALKDVMSELSTRQLIKTKTGRTGGCWLTERGCSRARKLRRS